MRCFLELCLRSVEAAISKIDAEIIVIDNNSDDESCDMIKRLFPEVKLIENKDNFGFSKGNNIGVRQAKGDYLCILNPDTVVAEDTFLKLLKFSKKKKKLGIIGCRLIDGKGRFLPESKRKIPYVKAAFKKIFGNSNDYYANHLNENETGKVDVLVGAFMFLERAVYNDIKGFDEDYFMYGEDIDISYKALKNGYCNYYYGGTTVMHFKGESTLKDKRYARRFYGAMQIFYKKHFKKNIGFDMFVWIGIRLASIYRKKSDTKAKRILEYIFVSNNMNEKLRAALSKKVVLKSDLGMVKKASEIIFDANYVSYKTIIENINIYKDEFITFKILPHKSGFILGSDNSTSRGEIIYFD